MESPSNTPYNHAEDRYKSRMLGKPVAPTNQSSHNTAERKTKLEKTIKSGL